MKLKYHNSILKFENKIKEMTCPYLEDDEFICRVYQDSDKDKIQHLTDPGMVMHVNDKFYHSLDYGIGYSPDLQGIVLIVLEHKKTGKIVGKSYLKFWHQDSFKRPRYHLNFRGGIDIIDARELKTGSKIIEFGGMFIQKDFRGKNLSNPLLAIRFEFIKNVLAQELKPNSLMIINIGPYKEANNFKKINMSQKMLEYLKHKRLIPAAERQYLWELVGHGEIISRKELTELFKDFKVEIIDRKRIIKRHYQFGLPRLDSYPAFLYTQRLLQGLSIMDIDGTPYYSPYDFMDVRCIHCVHGGNYFISHVP